MNPFDLTGPQFLVLWVTGLIVVAVATMVIRASVARSSVSHAQSGEVANGLGATEVAYLVAGIERAIEAAVAGLHHRGAIEVVDGRLSEPTEQTAPGEFRGVVGTADLSQIERFVLEQVAHTSSVEGLVLKARSIDEQLRARFEREGLLLPLHATTRIKIALPGLLWWLFGAVKVLVGLSRGRNVLILVIALVGLAVALAWASALPRLTTFGSQVVQRVKSRTHGLSTTAKAAPEQLSGSDMTLAYAVLGPAILTGALVAMMPSHVRERARVRARRTAAAGSAGSCSSCGSSCSSCGGGCGGGCGGCS